jgi:UPF0755 protein
VLKKILFTAIVLILATTLGVTSYLSKELKNPLLFSTESVSYVVTPGSSLKKVLSDFEKNGWVKSARVHEYWLRYNKLTNIQRGEYTIENGLTSTETIQKLIDGKKVLRSVQFIEGKTFSDALIVLKGNPHITQTLEGLSNIEILNKISSEFDYYEGLFFPDTYLFEKGTTDLELLQLAFLRMQNVLAEEWENKSTDTKVTTPYEALILASIIEKETGAAFEREMISAVFTRRLEKGMRLQTDPTVIYGLGEDFNGNLTRSHLRADTPYNTYTRKGLPPTPIANPGREAIAAALNPSDGKEIFFVAKGDGTHYFSVTLEEHNAAVRKYQRFGRRSDYKSSPATQDETSE